MWNDANLRRKWLSRYVGWRGGNRRFRWGRLRRLCRRGLEVLEGLRVRRYMRLVDAALKAGKWIESGMESVAEGGIVSDGGVEEIGVAEIFIEAFDLVVPELGFDSAESALDPLGRDEGVDQSELVGV